MTQANSMPERPVLDVSEGATRDNSSLGVAVYYEIMHRTVKEGTPRHRRIRREAKAFLKQVGPRDPLEQVLAEQILWMHATMANLSHFAAMQKRGRWFKVYHAARDRLSNACRKHIMALAEYRRPRRSSFTAVHQANIAQQQIVTTAQPLASSTDGRQKSLESGEAYVDCKRALPSQGQTPLPLERAGAVREARAHPADPAVEMEHGTQDADGQAAIQPEPSDSRLIQP
ncbi:MAG: hypothetical protein ABR964_10020 [Tepidisphaeraceae bacterium]|jgi:hypothetical protein